MPILGKRFQSRSLGIRMIRVSNKFRIISQWHPYGGTRNWGFVPFSIWSTEDFFGIVLFNYCFEWARTEAARRIYAGF